MSIGRASALSFLGVGVLCGCAYFNGLYNANRLVKEATKAEREGRVGEARSLWSRAAVKAESVAVRYSGSKYYDDALLLHGQALIAAGRCESATAPLALAIEVSRDSPIVEEANLLLGRCRVALGELDSAVAALSRAVPSDDTLLASAAHLWRGRARVLMGLHEAAAADFRASSHVDAAFDLAVALARLGLPEEVERVLRRRVDGPYLADLWLETLDTVGVGYPELAAAVVDLLLDHEGLARVEQGNLLLRDGTRRAASGETHAAMARFRQVVDVVPEAATADAARFWLLVGEARTTADLERLPRLVDSLAAIAGVPVSQETPADELAGALAMAAAALDEQSGGSAPADDWRRLNPDLEMFLAAEAIRDRVKAPLLAAALFKEVGSRFPRSQLAPKALLAAASLDIPAADSLIAVVRVRYPGSPYTLVLDGSAHDAYAALEDSLRALIMSRPGAS